MADYVATLKNDLVEQFRGKANIEALMEVIGAQLQQVYDFYDQLRQDRGVHTAVGKQLDGVGDIVVMTRMEAGKLAGDPIPFEVIDDETYRRYLIYKILKNTCDCTRDDDFRHRRNGWHRRYDAAVHHAAAPRRWRYPEALRSDEDRDGDGKALHSERPRLCRHGNAAAHPRTRY